MIPAKTAAQRQAERKARELAAGRVQWKRWAHPDDVPALAEYADKLARKRARTTTIARARLARGPRGDHRGLDGAEAAGMRLELNTNGSWRVVLRGLDEAAVRRACEAVAVLGDLDASKRPAKWRIVSEATDRVISRCEGPGGWRHEFLGSR